MVGEIDMISFFKKIYMFQIPSTYLSTENMALNVNAFWTRAPALCVSAVLMSHPLIHT